MIFNTGHKPIFTAGLDAGGEISVMKIGLSPPACNTGQW
jgi:hypothetical protein